MKFLMLLVLCVSTALSPELRGCISSESAAKLSVYAVYRHARNAGFSKSLAVTMVAIVEQESYFQPKAIGVSTRETSYGLTQINWKDKYVRQYLVSNGIHTPQALLDPATNMRAAYLLYRGREENIYICWYASTVASPKFRARVAKYSQLLT
jgi:hypothetical protein